MIRKHRPFFTLQLKSGEKPTPEVEAWLLDSAWRVIDSVPEFTIMQKEFEADLEAEERLAKL